MSSAALPLSAAGIVAAASPAVLALMKSRLFIGPLFVFVAKRLRGSLHADCNIEWKDFRSRIR
jgi:hypothetical protein